MTSDELAYKLESPQNVEEQARLDVQHQVWLLSMNGSLRASAIPAEFEPKSALDVGCGSGTWAVSYALNYPRCQVTAMDIKPPSGRDWPTNLRMVTESVDVEQEHQWPPDETFDYIHLRMLTVALKDYALVLHICWKHLNPGGWLEINDARFQYAAENEAANSDNSYFLQAAELHMKAQTINGIDVGAPQRHVERLKMLGFVDVGQMMVKWPVNGEWPEDEKLKQIGALTEVNWQQMWSKYGPILLTTKLSMDKDEAVQFCGRVLRECRDDRDMHYYFPLDVTTARRPIPHLE